MNKNDILAYIDQNSESIKDIALQIWNNPEISGTEEHSAQLYRTYLKANGFTLHEVKRMDHAFYAEYGKGAPVIAILGEYDALPDLSQKLDTKYNPVAQNGPGHGCGHNLLGAASFGAALDLKEYLDDANCSGTIRYYACPEEETLCGKVKMILAGAFENCDLALSWHPMNGNTALNEAFLANNSIKFKFHGISAHASQSPESGRSALDAVELMNVGVNYLREHIIEKARIYYTITNAGGAPNIIPKEAESWYYVRAPHRKDVNEITDRLVNIAKGAALMTDTKMEFEIISGCYEMLPNDVLFDLTIKNMKEIGAPKFTDEEYAYAKAIQESLDPKIVENERKKFISAQRQKVYIHDEVLGKEKLKNVSMAGSSDSGDVSWIMPMNLFLAATGPLGCRAFLAGNFIFRFPSGY